MIIGVYIVCVLCQTAIWIEEMKQPIIYHAEAKEIESQSILIEAKVDWTEERIKEEVLKKADAHNVSFDQMWNTIKCENESLNPDLQSQLKYEFDDTRRGIYVGMQEKSYGIAQIHIPDHPHVSIEEAKDPEFAIEFMANAFSNGKQVWWTCWRKLYL